MFSTNQNYPESLDSNFPMYIDNTTEPDNSIIVVQPTNEYPETRRPIPVSTIDWQSRTGVQFTAGEGVDFLRGVEQLHIQQTVELTNLSSSQFVDSVNRYKVVVPHGETLYYAMETSSENQRLFCGTNREFEMLLYDHTQQEALILKRRIGCGYCSIWCYLHLMEVWGSYDQYIGKIKQNFSLTVPAFSVYNDQGNIVYNIEGSATCGCTKVKEAHFKIYSPDGLTQLGSINHQWDQVKCDYNLAVYFPNRRDHPKNKALLVGAAFLLEYMFFINARKTGCC